MKLSQLRLPWLLVLPAALALTACGGGGGAPADAGTVVVIAPPGEPLQPYPDPIDEPPPPPPPPPPVDDPAPDPVVDPPQDPPVFPPFPPVPPPAVPGFDAALDIAFDPDRNALYAVDNATGALLARYDGAFDTRLVRTLQMPRVLALAWRPSPARLYALVGEQPGAQALAVLDPELGDVLDVLPLASGLMLTALEWHDRDQAFYAVDATSHALVMLDEATGAVLRARPLDLLTDVRGLAVVPDITDLVLLDRVGQRLLRVDRFTAAPLAVQFLNRSDLSGLAERGQRYLTLDVDDNLLLGFVGPSVP